MQRPFLRAVSLFLSAVVALFAGSSWAAQRPPIDALADSPIVATSGARAKAVVRPDLVQSLQIEERLDLPTFVWLKAASDTSRAKSRSPVSPEQAARDQLKEIAELYRMSPAEIDAAPLHHVERLLDNGYLVRFTNQLDGIEVFRESAGVAMNDSLQVVAVGGYLGQTLQAKSLAKAAARTFALSPAEAIAIAMGDYGFVPSISALLQPRGSKAALARSAKASKSAKAAPYLYYSLNATSPTGAYLSTPARAKAVWYRMPEGLVPAYYVETQMYDPAVRDVEFYGYVIAADDGRMLFRHHQQEDVAFTYKTYAETGGINLPFPGPQGRGGAPHPTGLNDGFQATFVPQNDITLQNGPISTNDPWLPAGATRTIGNNVEAWANLFGPPPPGPGLDPNDGTFNADPQECNMSAPITGDFHACVSAPGVFSYVFDPLAAAQATKLQSVAATVNLFYVNNWLHDWYYDAGFKEIDGNAQDDNFGRGGLGGDSIRAQAQDYSGTDNANMSTPADGARPRMRMYVFSGTSAAALGVNSPAGIAGEYAVNIAQFGAQVYDLTNDVVQAQDALEAAAGSTTTDGCSPFTNAAAVAGKIALIDRGVCGFVVKVKNAQNAGAIGAIIANVNPASAFTPMGGTDATITIPSALVTVATGNLIKANLAAPVNVHLRRIFGNTRDGTLDNQIIAHEWGHYISNRLVGNSSGLVTNMSRGLGEGWADFHSMLLTVKAEDALVAANANFNGTYGMGGYVSDGPQIAGVTQSSGYYYGIRRYPYSSNTAKNPLSYRHITTGVALPASPPAQFGGDNAEVHNTGEVWTTMLWQCYSSLLRDTGRLTFAQAQDRMKKYIVAGYKLTPVAPTLLEARDAILAAMFANDVNDFNVCAATFASRGAGFQAKPPTDRFSTTNAGLVESTVVSGSDLAITSSVLNTRSALFCDADPYLDNGETAKLAVTIRNSGLQAVTGAVVTISSATSGVTFPGGPSVLTGTIQPFASETVFVDVGISGAAPISLASLTATVTHPSVLTPVPALTVTVKTQRDDLPNSSATDNVESELTPWTSVLQGTTAASLNWSRVEYGATDHKWNGPGGEAGGIAWLTSPSLLVGPTGPFSMSFSHRFDFEFDASLNYDGGVIEVSDDNGATWVDIQTIAPMTYNGTIGNYTGNQNPAGGRPGYVRQSAGYPAMIPVTINFPASYLGKTVRVRFGSSSDESFALNGWDVDDIAFTGITNTPFATLAGDTQTCATIAVEGTGQSATVNTAFATPLKATVTRGGSPVVGVNVSFTATAPGAGGTFPGGLTTVSLVTNASGVATAPAFTANGTVGSYNVTAQAGLNIGLFALTNTAAVDTTPDAFTFTDQVNVQAGTVVTSNAITVTGISAPAAIAVTGGSYSVGCTAAFVTAAATIGNGQTVCVRHTAPLALGVVTSTTLTIGGVSDTFTSTTAATLDPAGDADNDGVPNGVENPEALNPLVKDNDIFTSSRLFAMQQYRDFLGREGDAAGITSWVNFVNGGGTRPAEIEAFFGSAEFQGTGSPVARLYFAFFLRIPDYGGITFWTSFFRAGNSLTSIADAFAGSAEFTSRYGTLTNDQFVDLVYQNVLGRPADAGGKAFWLGQLNGGMSRGTMMTGFSESAEFKTAIFSETYVTMMYVGMLKREPDTGGFNFWVGYLDGGNSGQALINGFLLAPEYRNRFLP